LGAGPYPDADPTVYPVGSAADSALAAAGATVETPVVLCFFNKVVKCLLTRSHIYIDSDRAIAI